MYQYILFDLDGTLTDSKEGITKSAQYALRSFGIEEKNLDKLEPFIGPPLSDSFREFYGMNEADTEKAVRTFRERFETVGITENKIYPGVKEMLQELKDNGCLLAIASSKPEVSVHRVLQMFDDCNDFGIIHKDSDKRTSPQKHRPTHYKAEYYDQHCRTLISALHALYVSGPEVLCRKRRNSSTKRVVRLLYQLFNPGGRRKCGNHIFAEPIDHRLKGNTGQRNQTSLHSKRDAKP